MLGGVAEVVSSNLTVGHKIFSAFTGIYDYTKLYFLRIQVVLLPKLIIMNHNIFMGEVILL